MTDKDPAAKKRAVAHGLHAVLPLDRRQRLGDRRLHRSSRSRAARSSTIRLNNLFIGLGIALALLAHRHRRRPLGRRPLMSDKELIEPRHAHARHATTTRAAAVEVVRRRQRGVRLQPPHADPQHPDRAPSSPRSLPAVVLFRGLAPEPDDEPGRRCSSTPCGQKGTRLTRDPDGTPIRPPTSPSAPPSTSSPRG